jgi:hypothetical protein
MAINSNAPPNTPYMISPQIPNPTFLHKPNKMRPTTCITTKEIEQKYPTLNPLAAENTPQIEEPTPPEETLWIHMTDNTNHQLNPLTI